MAETADSKYCTLASTVQVCSNHPIPRQTHIDLVGFTKFKVKDVTHTDASRISVTWLGKTRCVSLQRTLGSPPVKGPTEEAHQQDKPVSNTRDANSCDSSDDWPDEKFNAFVGLCWMSCAG